MPSLLRSTRRTVLVVAALAVAVGCAGSGGGAGAVDAGGVGRDDGGGGGPVGDAGTVNAGFDCMTPSSTDAPVPVVPPAAVPPPVTAAAMHDMAALCDPDHQTGTSGPVAVCSPAVPCPDGVTAGTTTPTCGAGDQVITWQDSVIDPSNLGADGVASPDTRYACAPADAPAGDEPVPLVVYFTPSFSSAENMYQSTNLRSKADTFVWPYGTPSGQSAVGFVLVIAQERNLQLGALGPGGHEDTYYRPNQPALNPDIRNADALIDWAVAHYGSRIDRRRIYVTGWSNGAIFGQLYAIARHPSSSLAKVAGSGYGQPTPAGNYVAAAAVYSGDDPFIGFPSGDCGTRTYPTTQVPIYLAHRACDLVPCNESQQECIGGYASRSFEDTTGASTDATVEFWLGQELTATSGWHAMADPNVADVIFDVSGNRLPPGPASCRPSQGGESDGNLLGGCNTYADWIPTPADDPTPGAVTSVATTSSGCSPAVQTLNHVLWPSADEPTMLAFLAGYTAAPACP